LAGHSRSKNGVASLAYVPAIHVFSPGAVLTARMPAIQASEATPSSNGYATA
jgi:hypothetical protein